MSQSKSVSGIVELTTDVSTSAYYSRDMAPIGAAGRKWGMRDMAALWISMAACIPTYMLASSAIKEGMNWWQAILTIFLGNVIVLIPMLLNAHAGTRYGIPFPVYCRASFGIRGANVPAMLRALVACGWFGIQTWIGGDAIYTIGEMRYPSWHDLPKLWGIDINVAQLYCFLFFWAINILVIYMGVNSIRWLLNFKAPLLIALGLLLLAWAYREAHGFGPILDQGSQFDAGGPKAGQFWTFFFPMLTANVGFWATLSLNIPDFSRFARSQRDQVVGQTLGLPTTMALFAFIGVAVTSATIVIYHKTIWNPVELLKEFHDPIVLAGAMFALCLATLATNIAANVVSPANDFAHLWPKRISFRTGGLITGLLGILIQPWRLLNEAGDYIFVWLNGYSALLGAVGGVLIADYFVIRKTRLDLAGLYRRDGPYWYCGGFNIKGLLALVLGIAPCVPGFLNEVKLTKADPFWAELYHYTWFVSLGISFLSYTAMMKCCASRCSAVLLILALSMTACIAADPPLVTDPEAFKTLVNPNCSHCRDEAKRRADLRPDDRVMSWTRGYSSGGAVPIRFFLNPYRVISDSYGVFVYDPDAGYARGFAPSYEFRFHGWRNGVMVMKHNDGTLYSCLSGIAFEGPKKGTRLKAIPTLVSDWGWWMEQYPDAVAYHMFDKYQPVELPKTTNPLSVKSRGKPDPRLKVTDEVLGTWTGKAVRAYPIEALARSGILSDTIGEEEIVILWEPKTKTASAYRPIASQPRKYKAPQPDSTGVSKLDEGVPLPAGTPIVPARQLTIGLSAKESPGRFQDAETKSFWDVAGRCVSGDLKGYTLEWVDSVQVKWFAWAAEYPCTSVYTRSKQTSAIAEPAETNKKVKAIAGTAEFLRLLPKPFATVKAIDPKARTVTLVADGTMEAKTWPLEPDAEVKVGGWWGRLEQFKPGDRVWVWLKLDRRKNPVSIVMLADELTEFDMHGSLRLKPTDKPKFIKNEVDARRTQQRAWLRKVWTEEGLPGTLTFHHVFSGELELTLDHEAMRWGRSLSAGDVVHVQAEPPIKAVVKAVRPWRERTVLRLVVGELESSELKIGQRLMLKMTPLAEEADSSIYPPDMNRARTRADRIDWFLASTYCTCGVSKDVCTGHFYTVASCNPNACAMPDYRREQLEKMIDRGLNDREILDELLNDAGPLVLRPHLMP